MVARIGKRQVEKLAYWMPTFASFGGAAGLGIVYFTDWKLILQYVPIINKKFESTE